LAYFRETRYLTFNLSSTELSGHPLGLKIYKSRAEKLELRKFFSIKSHS